MKKNNIEGWLFVSPLVIWISLIILVPIYIAFELSLFNVKIIGTSGKFVGIDNYIKLFGKSKFVNASLNSFYWIIGNAICQTFFAFTIALTINYKFPGKKIMANWIILSYIIPTVVVVVKYKSQVETMLDNSTRGSLFGFTNGNTFTSISSISAQNLLAQSLQLTLIDGKSAKDAGSEGMEIMTEAIE